MRLWRISNYVYLKGIGGLRTAARWHNKGIPVVYLAESPALAMLEILVHFDMEPGEVPEHYQLLEVEYDGRKGVYHLDETVLGDNWRSNRSLTRAIGDKWLTGFGGALLRVPSVIVPHSFNYLLNPRHPAAAEAKIVSVHQHPFDSRLVE